MRRGLKGHRLEVREIGQRDSSIFPDEEGTESLHQPGNSGEEPHSSIFPDEEGTERA